MYPKTPVSTKILSTSIVQFFPELALVFLCLIQYSQYGSTHLSHWVDPYCEYTTRVDLGVTQVTKKINFIYSLILFEMYVI